MRRRYIQDRETGKLREVTTERTSRLTPFIQDDIEPFVSHVDGSIISSRSKLRQHNRQHNVIPVAEYGAGNYCDPNAFKERVAKLQGRHEPTNKERLRDVIGAWKRHTGDL